MRHGLHILCLVLGCAAVGCSAVPHRGGKHAQPLPPVPGDMPRELSKIALPEYIIEPPDILVIEALQLIPKSPYHVRSGDVLSVQVEGTLPDSPISGPYAIEPGGVLNLGAPYGLIKVGGLDVDAVQKLVHEHLLQHLRDPIATVSLLQMSGTQQIAGQHLVGPDGQVNLGSYGSVSVVGMTVPQAKAAIEAHLSLYLERPEIAVDIFAYNSKVYYIVSQGAGLGDTITRFPITGNETVLDALSNVNGFSQVASKKMWVARPTPYTNDVQILPVDWAAITAEGATATNYQLMPGDRLFIAEDKWVAFDTSLGKLLAPIERAMGFTLLGVNTASRLSGKVLNNNNGGGNNGNFGGGF